MILLIKNITYLYLSQFLVLVRCSRNASRCVTSHCRVASSRHFVCHHHCAPVALRRCAASSCRRLRAAVASRRHVVAPHRRVVASSCRRRHAAVASRRRIATSHRVVAPRRRVIAQHSRATSSRCRIIVPRRHVIVPRHCAVVVVQPSHALSRHRAASSR